MWCPIWILLVLGAEPGLTEGVVCVGEHRHIFESGVVKQGKGSQLWHVHKTATESCLRLVESSSWWRLSNLRTDGFWWPTIARIRHKHTKPGNFGEIKIPVGRRCGVGRGHSCRSL